MLLAAEKTYSFQEFVQILNEKNWTKEERTMKEHAKKCGTELTLPVDYLTDVQLKEYRKLDKKVGSFLSNAKTSKVLITLVASMMHYVPAFADASTAVIKIRSAGDMLFGICREASYSICLVMCCVDILSALLRKDTKAVSKIIAIYIMSFAGLYFLPWIFDMIRDIFD